MQLTTVQGSHKQLSLDHEKLQTSYNQRVEECAQAALELREIKQELAEAKLDADTSKFLQQACHYSRHASSLKHVLRNILLA